MSYPPNSELTGRNYDIFRGSVTQLEPARIVRALDWLDGKGPFPKPVSVHYDLTLRCSAHCVHCEQWRWPKHRELSGSQLRTLFDTFHRWGVETLTLGGGNPLLYENLPDVLTLASERSLAVGIVSEGATLSPAVADSIALRSSWVRFSLDGPSPEIHDRIRRAPGLFALAAAAIAELRARRPRLPIGLNCVVQKDNVGHLAEMTAAAERLGADAIFFKLSHGDDPGRRFLLGADEFRQFQEWVGQSAQERHGVTTNLAELSTMLSAAVSPEDAAQGRPIRGYYLRKGIRCFVPMFFLACDSEGNAYPCDYLQGDTRPWEGHHADMRSKFCAGNILAEGDMVLERMADLVRSQVHGLPCGGYDECGCCTRFCQLNTALSWIERNHGAERAIALAVLRDRARKPEPGSAASPFL